MEEAERSFIEGMGLLSEEDGLPRTAGHIYGLLILREGSLSLEEIASELAVSKASVSTNARLLARMGVIERTSRPGDRRDFYRTTADAPERELDHVVQRLQRMRELLIDTIRTLTADKRVQHHRLASMRDWHTFLLDEIDALAARWQGLRGHASRGSDREADHDD